MIEGHVPAEDASEGVVESHALRAGSPRRQGTADAFEGLFDGDHGAECYPARARLGAGAPPRRGAGTILPRPHGSLIMTKQVPGELDGRGLRVAVLVARWYPEVTDRLREGALATLESAGVAEKDLLVVEVPGAYELPQAATWVTRAGLADAVVALGCVVRGETPHFDHIARAAADGCLRAAQESGVPVAFGVITADTRAQAEARASDVGGGVSQKGGNKGVEAADAAVRLAHTFRRLEEGR